MNSKLLIAAGLFFVASTGQSGQFTWEYNSWIKNPLGCYKLPTEKQVSEKYTRLKEFLTQRLSELHYKMEELGDENYNKTINESKDAITEAKIAQSWLNCSKPRYIEKYNTDLDLLYDLTQEVNDTTKVFLFLSTQFAKSESDRKKIADWLRVSLELNQLVRADSARQELNIREALTEVSHILELVKSRSIEEFARETSNETEASESLAREIWKSANIYFIFQEFSATPLTFDFSGEMKKADSLSLLERQNYLDLLKSFFPNNADNARLLVRKLIQMNFIPGPAMLSLVRAAKEVDSSWEPNPPSESTLNDRLLALSRIEQTFPKASLEAAKRTLHALELTHFDTILGSSNRMIHKEKTGGWVECANVKNFRISGQEVVLSWNKIDKPGKTNAFEMEFKFKTLEQSPILDTSGVPARWSGYSWFPQAALAYYDRSGNCTNRAALTLYYLIKNSFRGETKTDQIESKGTVKRVATSMSKAIERVEYVAFTDMDHAFLVINRAEGSILGSPTTWGENALVADPWVWDIPELRLYTAGQAVANLKKVRMILAEENAAQDNPILTSDLLQWWRAHETIPLPIIQAPPFVDNENLPITTISDEYVDEYKGHNRVGDTICLLPDLSQVTIPSLKGPDKKQMEKVLQSLPRRE